MLIHPHSVQGYYKLNAEFDTCLQSNAAPCAGGVAGLARDPAQLCAGAPLPPGVPPLPPHLPRPPAAALHPG